MNTTKMSTLLVLVLGLMVCQPKVSEAEPMGTAFTYQGRLIDANEAADGLYDFQFKLFDANSGGNKYGTDVNKPEVDVIDGYFTVELDFGSVFDGNDRWLLIGVRPGDSNDPNEYTILEPCQKITPAPYALYAKSGTSGPVGPVGPEGPKGDEPAHQWSSTSLRFQNPNGTWGSYVNLQGPQGLIGAQGAMGPRPDHQWSGTSLRFQVASGSWGSYVNLLGPQGPAGDSHWLLNGDATYYNTGNVGIGTNSPERILHIVGVNPRILIEASSISPEINFKNTGDSASEMWSLYKDGGTDDLRFYQNGNRVTIQNSTGNVGIGTTSPWSKLSVGGPGYAYTGIYGEGGDYGIYGFSASGVGVYGINNSTYNEGMLGSSDYGVKGSYGSSGNFGYIGGSDYGVMGKHNNTGNYGYLGGSAYAVCGIASSGFGVRGESSANGVGVSGINNTSGNYGLLGGPTRGVYGSSASGYGVAGYSHNLSSSSAGVYGHSDYGYGVYGSSGNVYGAKAGYFEGNVYVTREMSAENVVDRTPYPKDLATAYNAVISMERLPDGQYQENNKENQLDHSKLSSFIRSKDGNRDLSATVSCLNEVVTDLVSKVEAQQKLIETQNAQIQQMTEMLQTNSNLKSLSRQEQ